MFGPLCDPIDIVGGFNEVFFVNVSSSLTSTIKVSDVKTCTFIKGSFSPLFVFDPPNAEKVYEIIKNLKNSVLS